MADAPKTNRPGGLTRVRLTAGPPGVRSLMLAFAVLSLAQYAVTTALAIYGFTVAGALGAGLAGARVIPSAFAGIFGGQVAARARPGFALLGGTAAEVLALAAMPDLETKRERALRLRALLCGRNVTRCGA